ncbi:uncharacterized protein LOC129793427 isoform X1 [Lutzomyia longipalpis]|uniref:uncharacterized protein LOC129793427 isoform X1 n=1 Tax=Lutzomyia longipalpis TaxID=7200 RepID=UPI002483D560|nr:uncharacterized protein LOC129793427 isoform X1 [Lutzomyia longipalpis]
MSEAKVESETPLPQRAQNQGNPGNQAMKANNDGDGQMGGSQQMGGGGGGGPMGGKKPQQRNFQQGKNMRGGNRGFGGGGGGPRNQMNRQNRGNPQRNEGQMKFSKKRQNEPNRDGGDDRMQQQQRGPFQRPKNEDFGIQQRLKHLQGPMHDIPPLDQSEIKFCGRNRLYIGNLTNDVTEEELRQLFAPFGEIGEVFLNPEKNFAFIKVDYHANAERAKRELDGTMRKGKQMRIRFAPNGTILKVRNIAPFVSNELLYKSFEVFGQVERAVVIVDDRGKPSGEGIVEYSRKASAMTAMRLCSERCYFLTSSLRPVVLEMMEHVDDIDGYPEKSINKKMNDFGQARQVGPRFAEPGSFEHEYGTRWKQLYEMFKQKQDGLKRELAIEEDKLEAQMEYARYEHETEMLREQLRMREQDRDRQKKQWEMKKDHHEEMRTREEVQMRQHQEDIQMRMMRQDDELRKRQQENTLFMQAQQLSSLLDQQERKNFDDRRGNFNNQGGPDMNQMNQMNKLRAKMKLDEKIVKLPNQPEYPSEKFPNGFTGVPLIVSREKDMNKVARSVAHGLSCDNLKIQEAVHFLYMFGLEMEKECPKDINCFGKPWLKKGEKVTPLTPFNIEFNDYVFDNVDPNPPLLVNENASLAFRIICIYRVHKTKNDTHKASLQRRAQTYMRQLEINGEWRGTATPNSYNGWPNNDNFAKIVAGFDWFFVLFPDHPLAQFRFGSFVTRMAECSVYHSFKNICNALIPYYKLPLWIFDEQMMNEYVIIGKESDFLNEKGSIFPYFACLRMSRRSPWGIEQCPLLHTWFNIIGCLAGCSDTSKDAILPPNINLKQLIDYATLAVYAWTNGFGAGRMIVQVDENQDELKRRFSEARTYLSRCMDMARIRSVDNTSDEGGDGSIPSKLDLSRPVPWTQDPDEILIWYIKRGYELNDELKRRNKHDVSILVPLRLGTIGHALYTMIIGPVPAEHLKR